MATLLEVQHLINDADFQARIRVQVIKTGDFILLDESRAPEHPYFWNVLNNPESRTWLMPVVYQVALNGTIQASNGGTDSDIEYVVNSVITKFSVPVQP